MTGRRHAVLATVALVPALAYEAVEIYQGEEGWPYSRFLRLLPPVIFLGGLASANAVLIPHILRRAARVANDLAELVDDALAPFDHEETP